MFTLIKRPYIALLTLGSLWVLPGHALEVTGSCPEGERCWVPAAQIQQRIRGVRTAAQLAEVRTSIEREMRAQARRAALAIHRIVDGVPAEERDQRMPWFSALDRCLPQISGRTGSTFTFGNLGVFGTNAGNGNFRDCINGIAGLPASVKNALSQYNERASAVLGINALCQQHFASSPECQSSATLADRAVRGSMTSFYQHVIAGETPVTEEKGRRGNGLGSLGDSTEGERTLIPRRSRVPTRPQPSPTASPQGPQADENAPNTPRGEGSAQGTIGARTRGEGGDGVGTSPGQATGSRADHGLGVLQERMNYTARQEAVEMLGCTDQNILRRPRGVAACTQPAPEVLDARIREMIVQSERGVQDLFGYSPSTSEFNRRRAYEEISSLVIGQAITGTTELALRDGLGQEYLRQLDALANSCGNPNIRRYIQQKVASERTRIGNVRAEREAQERAAGTQDTRPESEQLNDDVYEAAADLRQIDSDISRLMADMYNPNSTPAENALQILQWMNTGWRAYVMPCRSFVELSVRIADAIGRGEISRQANRQCILENGQVRPNPNTVPDRVVRGRQTISCSDLGAGPAQCRRSCRLTGDGGAPLDLDRASGRFDITEADRILHCSVLPRVAEDGSLILDANGLPSLPRGRERGADTPTSSLFIANERGETTTTPQERCDMKMSLIASHMARRATILARLPELGNTSEGGQPLYQRVRRTGAGSAVRAVASRQARDHTAQLRDQIQRTCANPEESASPLLANPTTMRELMSCGGRYQPPVAGRVDPSLEDPTAESACKYLRHHANELCQLMPAHQTMDRNRRVGSLLVDASVGTVEAAFTALDTMMCAQIVGGIAQRLIVAPLQAGGNVVRHGTGLGIREVASQAARAAGRTASEGAQSAARATAQQATHAFTTARGLTTITAFTAVGAGMAQYGRHQAAETLREQTVRCLSGNGDACAQVPQLQAQYAQIEQETSLGATVRSAILGALIPGDFNEIPVAAVRSAQEALSNLQRFENRLSVAQNDLASAVRELNEHRAAGRTSEVQAARRRIQQAERRLMTAARDYRRAEQRFTGDVRRLTREERLRALERERAAGRISDADYRRQRRRPDQVTMPDGQGGSREVNIATMRPDTARDLATTLASREIARDIANVTGHPRPTPEDIDAANQVHETMFSPLLPEGQRVDRDLFRRRLQAVERGDVPTWAQEIQRERGREGRPLTAEEKVWIASIEAAREQRARDGHAISDDQMRQHAREVIENPCGPGRG